MARFPKTEAEVVVFKKVRFKNREKGEK